MTGLIYGIRHDATDRWYVGQTIHTLEHRIKEHISCAENGVKLHLYNAIRKYGLSAFSVYVLESNIDVSVLDAREQFYIAYYDAFNKGFNNTLGGGGVRGYKHTQETKAKISKTLKENSYKWNTEERARKIIAAQKGRTFTLEHRLHISQACKGKRFGVDNPFYQKHHSESTKQSISEANHKYAVEQVDRTTGSVIAVYPDLHAAVRAILPTRTNVKYTSVYDRIRIACYRAQGTQSAYGFVWNLIDKSVTTNCKAEDELLSEVLDNSKS